MLIIHIGATSQCVLVCNSNVEIALDSTGNTSVDASDLLDFIDPACDSNLVVSVGGANLVLADATTTSISLDCQAMLATTYLVGDTITGNVCWGNITVTDPFNTCIDSLLSDEVIVDFVGSFTGPFVENVDINGVPLRHLGLNSFALDTTVLNAGSNTFNTHSYNSLNGVSTLDIVLIQQFLFGNNSFTGIEAVRADADGSGYVGTDDVFVLMETVLGVTTPRPYLVTKENATTNAIDPYDFTDLYDLTYDRAEITSTGLTFEVYQPGDVNGSARFTGMDDPLDSRSTYEATFIDRPISEDEVVSIALTLSDQEVAGCHISFDQTHIDILDIQVEQADMPTRSVISNNQASIMYIPRASKTEAVIKISLKSKRSGYLSDLLKLDHRYPQEVITSDLSQRSLTLHASGLTSINEQNIESASLKVTPTLLLSQATIAVPDGTYNVEVYNISGQLVRRLATDDTVIILDRNDLPKSGLYILRAVGSYGQQSTRLIAK